jgi:hypothetical protein
MVNIVLGLALSLPAQAPQPPADLAARRQAELKALVERRRAKAEDRAVARVRARDRAAGVYMAELQYRARVAPYAAEQQLRWAQHEAAIRSDQAWLRVARHRALTYAYGVGAPVTVGPEGYQVYDGFADYGFGRP